MNKIIAFIFQPILFRHHCWLFDTRAAQWTLLKEIIGTDPEQAPAGLSSHSISPISSELFLVTGREGSVRYQKRFDAVFYQGRGFCTKIYRLTHFETSFMEFLNLRAFEFVSIIDQII